MQTTSTTHSSRKTTPSKVAAKTRGRAKSIPALHPKEQQPSPTPATGELASMIAMAAYFRAEQRGFEPGHELEDWLQAEQYVRRLYS